MLITLEEAAKKLQLSRRQIRHYIKQGRFPGASKLGGRWIVQDLTITDRKRAGNPNWVKK